MAHNHRKIQASQRHRTAYLVKLAVLLLSLVTIDYTNGSPVAHIHVKFVQPPHIEEHGITTDGGRIIEQKSYLSIGRKNPIVPQFQYGATRGVNYYPRNSPRPRLASQRSTFAPIEDNNINFSDREYSQPTPDFSNGLDYPDPLLLTGEAAMLAVKYIYGRGELFFHDIPHVRALLRNQEERRQNGLNGNILSSLRPASPWYRKD